MDQKREPAVAGQFYPGTKNELVKQVAGLVDPNAVSRRCIGAVSPHAGYIYSGSVAGSVFSAIRPAPVYVIIGPNHTGLGQQFSLSKMRSWKTPLGEVELDSGFAAALKKSCALVRDDDMAHQFEHSIEVQLPFLQYLHKDFKFVPIVAGHADLSAFREVGRAIADAAKERKLEKDVVIVASSDMTHYEPQAQAEKKDKEAIRAILDLDEEELLDTVASRGISMCGYAPVAIMITAARALGAKSAKLIKYATSGEATGDRSSVVGYAGLIIY